MWHCDCVDIPATVMWTWYEHILGLTFITGAKISKSCPVKNWLANQDTQKGTSKSWLANHARQIRTSKWGAFLMISAIRSNPDYTNKSWSAIRRNPDWAGKSGPVNQDQSWFHWQISISNNQEKYWFCHSWFVTNLDLQIGSGIQWEKMNTSVTRKHDEKFTIYYLVPGSHHELVNSWKTSKTSMISKDHFPAEPTMMHIFSNEKGARKEERDSLTPKVPRGRKGIEMGSSINLRETCSRIKCNVQW